MSEDAYPTLEDVRREYRVVDPAGDGYAIIASPGKFEGEPAFIVRFYAIGLDGCGELEDCGCEDGDCGCNTVERFEVDADDRTAFPGMLDGVAAVLLEYSDSGFVYCATEDAEAP